MLSQDAESDRQSCRTERPGDHPPMQSFSYQDLIQLIELIKSSSQFSEFRFKAGDLELELRRGDAIGRNRAPADAQTLAPAPVNAATAAAHPMPAAATTTPAIATPLPAAAMQNSAPSPAMPAAARPVTAQAAAEPPLPPGAHVIKAPMVGTFYRAPEPGAPPFVEVGTVVGPDTTVCIIEVMKLMNSMPAGCNGRIERILVADGEPVEHGQPLVVVVPAGASK